MDLARPALPYEPRMGRRDVADVRGKAVARIERVEPPHRSVADDLGHDRGGCDCGASFVAVDDGHVLRRARPEAEAVDETGFCRRRKRVQGSPQAREIRAVQAFRGRSRPARSPAPRSASHSRARRGRAPRAAPGFHLLRVVQKVERADAMIAQEARSPEARRRPRVGRRVSPRPASSAPATKRAPSFRSNLSSLWAVFAGCHRLFCCGLIPDSFFGNELICCGLFGCRLVGERLVGCRLVVDGLFELLCDVIGGTRRG